MRYSEIIKNTVRKLRAKGISLRQIAKKTDVPVTTIRLWTKDIKLSIKQADDLKIKVQLALQTGRIRSQKIQKELKNIKEKELLEKGILEIGKLSIKEQFIAGVALYWAEGFKNIHEHRLGFCNSDPNMIRFYVHWLEKCIGIKKEELVMRLTLNKIYKDKTEEIEKYWANKIGISLNQFTKPFYQESKWKRQYNTNNYHGVLRIHVKESLDCLLKMKGWIEGIKSNLPG